MALDRAGVATAVTDMLKADTGTLYGTGKLVQTITADSSRFDQAKIDRAHPFKVFLWAASESSPSIRSQNADEDYMVSFRIEGKQASIHAAAQVIDDTYERVKYLVNNQMFTGDMMTDYFTDANAQILNIEPTNSELPPPEKNENGLLVAECEGAILVQVNRWK